jgi:hypothetical protein
MKLRPKPPHLQFNLLLADPLPAELPTNSANELVQALADMLISAAVDKRPAEVAHGGRNESEADQ